jgi:hypothetical protein
VYERGERFTREMAGMRIADPSPGHHDLWMRVGLVLMLAGLALSTFGYIRSQAAGEALVQRDALALDLTGVSASIVIACAGHPKVPVGQERSGDATIDPSLRGGVLLGKRYEADGVEVLCTAAGDGTLTCDGREMVVKAAKPLSASD